MNFKELMKIMRVIIVINIITSALSVVAFSKTDVQPLGGMQMVGTLNHGESSYEDYGRWKLDIPRDYFIIEMQYTPGEVNLSMRARDANTGDLIPIDLYTDGWGQW